MTITEQELQERLDEAAERLQVPGVAVGMLVDGEERFAYHGVTSVENPLPVDEPTLFQSGSTGKTFTGTAVLRLVDRGDLDLDAPVRTYLPEFRVRDADATEKVTVLQLLNHTAGWAGDVMTDTGPGDDALERYVALLADADQATPPGESFSYNNAALSVAGHLIARTVGTTYEAAMKELLFEPLGLDHSFFSLNEIMTRRFAAGHNQKADGSIVVARPWALPRGGAPAGGISTNARDLVTWARFHMGDGCATDGSRVLSEDLLRRMQEPTVRIPGGGGGLGGAVGISWFITEQDGLKVLSHGGDTNGHHTAFVVVPDRRFAIAILTNSGPNGSILHGELTAWALEAACGITKTEETPEDRSAEELAPYVGTYETVAVTMRIDRQGGGLVATIDLKPDALAALTENGENPPEQPPIPIGMLDGDRFVTTGEETGGMTGVFLRDDGGDVSGIHVGGRLAQRART